MTDWADKKARQFGGYRSADLVLAVLAQLCEARRQHDDLIDKLEAARESADAWKARESADAWKARAEAAEKMLQRWRT